VAERLPAAVETAAYLAVAQALDHCAAAGASYARVSARRQGGTLLVEVAHDGSPAAARRLAVADRLGALGGHLESEPGRVRAAIPCA